MRSDTAITREPRPDHSRATVTLDAFSRGSAGASGVRLRDLSSCDSLHVRTRNSDYRLWLLNPIEGRVLVEGGTFFARPTEATVAGATVGGSLLKVGWILEGFNLEILYDGQRIVTTPVRWMQITAPESVPGPF